MTRIIFVIERIYNKQFKCNYLKQKKAFSKLFATFLKSKSKFERFGKKMTLRVYLFPKLQTVKDMIRKMSKKLRFRTLFDNQLAKGSQAVLKSSRHHFSHNFSLFQGKQS